MGHFLVPMLIKDGHEVYVASRGNKPVRTPEEFLGAKFIVCDSSNPESLEEMKAYGFDTVVDFPGTAYNVWNVLKNDISHLVACGSLWMFGYPHKIPTPEIPQSEVLFPGYKKRFAEMQEMLADRSAKAVFTGIMPPNVAGPGKIPLDAKAGRSAENHKAMMNGETVYLPEGPEALIPPCDAEDIASLFALAVNNRDAAAWELFNAGSGYAVPISDFVRIYAKIYGVDIPIEYVTWKKFSEELVPVLGDLWHFYAHMAPDITKAKTKLGYSPKYTPEETLRRSVEWMKQEKII